jgi:hypothetical protein
VVDFDGKAEWKPRSCPSEKALDAVDAAIALGLGNAEIVWLTDPPQARKPRCDEPDYGYGYEFEPCEAVVLRGYLNKYDLVQIV